MRIFACVRLCVYVCVCVRNFVFVSLYVCLSLDREVGQKGQNLLDLSIFVCLPFSIVRSWFDNLNLDKILLS